MQLKTKGIVLSETPYSETSKILNILSEDYGLIGVMSKGCRNVKNKLRGVSNKMNYCEYTINYKEKGLSTLIEGNSLNSFKNVYVDMKKAFYSFYLIDLINQVLKENNHKNIFSLLEQALIKINDGLSPELIIIIVELKLLSFLGVDLNLDSCVVCGEKKDLYTLSLDMGGMICQNCYQDGFVFNEKALKLIVILNKIDLHKLEKLEIDDYNIIDEIDNFIYEYYNNYTGIYVKKRKQLSNVNLM